MFDREGRNIDYIRVSITEKCNLRCIYCMPQNICNEKEDICLKSEDINKILKAASILGIQKVRFTGGEPLVVDNIEKIIYNTSKIINIKDISITTNGVLLGDMVTSLKQCGLNRVNLSLDTLKKDKFKVITKHGELSKVEDAINKCLSLNLELKLNTVLIRGINDDEITDLINLTKELPLTIRFIELMPIGEGEKFYKNGLITSEEILNTHSELFPTGTLDKGIAKLYKLPNAKGKVGFISPISCKFCNNCNKVRLTSKGIIKPCLHSEKELDLTPHLDNDLALVSALRESIYHKPKEHNLLEQPENTSKKLMYQIGG